MRICDYIGPEFDFHTGHKYSRTRTLPLYHHDKVMELRSWWLCGIPSALAFILLGTITMVQPRTFPCQFALDYRCPEELYRGVRWEDYQEGAGCVGCKEGGSIGAIGKELSKSEHEELHSQSQRKDNDYTPLPGPRLDDLPDAKKSNAYSKLGMLGSKDKKRVST